MTSNQKDDPPYLVGSIHRLSDGYGYGVRVPTARNLPTLPASVPKYRYPPDEQPLHNKPRQIIQTGEKGFLRHATQIVSQESGQYGRHYLFKDSEPVTINTQPLRKDLFATDPYQTLVRTRFGHSITSGNDSSRNPGNELTRDIGSSARSQDASTGRRSVGSTSRRKDYGEAGQGQLGYTATGSGGFSFTGTQTLHPTSFNRGVDKTFPRNCKYDLLASTIPPKPMWEQRSVAVTNTQNKEASGGWSRTLRQKSATAAVDN